MKMKFSAALFKEFLSYVGTNEPVFIDADDNSVTLTAWYNSLMFTATYPAQVAEEGTFTLPIKTLPIIKNAHRDVFIDFASKNGSIDIKVDAVRMKAQEAPEIVWWADVVPVHEFETTVLPWLKILNANRAKKSYGIPVTEGIHFSQGKAMALDGFRAAVYESDVFDLGTDSYVVPKEAFFFLSKVTENDVIKFSFSEQRVTVTTPKIRATTSILSGNFPSINAFPHTMPNELTVNAEEFEAILSQVVTIKREDEPPYVWLQSEGGFLKFSSTDGVINVEGKLGALAAGQEIDVFLNTEFLLDYVGNVTGDFYIEYGQPDSLVLLVQRNSLRQIIMPMSKRNRVASV